MSNQGAGDSEVLNITVKASGDKKLEISIKSTATVAELKTELAEKSGVPADQQRLIYSGRILKDPEELSTYKIKSGNALHLVKSAKSKREAPAGNAQASADAAGGGAATSGVGGINGAPPPSAMAAGQEASNPLSNLTGARYSGLANLPSASLFGPDGGQGPMPSLADINALMNEHPDLLDQAASMISQSGADENSPLFQSMPAHARQEARAVMSSPEMRQLMSDPQRLRQFMQASMQIQQLMEQSGAGAAPMGFPQPGAAGPNAGAAAGTEAGSTGAGGAGAANPFAANPFAANPFAGNPLAALAGAQGGLGGLGGANPYAAMLGGNGAGMPPVETDTRPPEERYETQLRQLNELGFFDFDRNVRALRRSGGNVEGAVEALLDNHV